MWDSVYIFHYLNSQAKQAPHSGFQYMWKWFGTNFKSYLMIMKLRGDKIPTVRGNRWKYPFFQTKWVKGAGPTTGSQKRVSINLSFKCLFYSEPLYNYTLLSFSGATGSLRSVTVWMPWTPTAAGTSKRTSAPWPPTRTQGPHTGNRTCWHVPFYQIR